MTLQQKNKEWRIFFVAFFLLLSFISNAATPEELEEEILFVTSYNSDTKYTYDNINTFVETYRQLGGKYSTIVENMNVTDLNQSRKWKRTLTNILDKHPNAKLVILLGLALFVVGVMFAYKLMMPFMLRFLSTGIEGADYIQTTTSIESYVSLCLTMFIIFGCVFEMPLVTIILSKMGIANPEILKKGRGVAIVLIFFIAAVVTPPDIVSQCMVAIPMVLLYFVSIFLSGIFYKPRSESEDEEDAEEEDED